MNHPTALPCSSAASALRLTEPDAAVYQQPPPPPNAVLMNKVLDQKEEAPDTERQEGRR